MKRGSSDDPLQPISRSLSLPRAQDDNEVYDASEGACPRTERFSERVGAWNFWSPAHSREGHR